LPGSQYSNTALNHDKVLIYVADIKSTTSKINYYKMKQYSTIKKIGFTTSTEKTKKY